MCLEENYDRMSDSLKFCKHVSRLMFRFGSNFCTFTSCTRLRTDCNKMNSNYPSVDLVKKVMDNIRKALLPEYFGEGENPRPLLACLAGEEAADALIARFPEIKRLIMSDAQALENNDPAAVDIAEIILCYPYMLAILYYRIAHALLELGVKLNPRMITEVAHSRTGIDIHPAARIGHHFCIDHGTGVVIGATAVIGNNVMLYQGVTLGAKKFNYDENGRMIDEPRHPILEDNVTVYSNTSILGRVRIGHDTVIGGNVWLTHDVPPGSKIVQSKALSQSMFSDGEGI